MDENEMIDILDSFENDDVEFKIELKPPQNEEKDRVIRTVGSFYNTRGGILIFGVRDSDHEPIGVTNPQLLETNFTSLVNGKFPQLAEMPKISFIDLEGKQLVIIRCPKGKFPPYIIRGEGGPRIRIGSSNLLANDEQTAQMYRDRAVEAQDRRIIQDAVYEDLDPKMITDYYRETRTGIFAGEEIQQTMKSEGFVTESADGILKPTIAGLLLFGKDPQRFLSSAVIKASAKTHKDQSEWNDLTVFDGNLFDQIKSAENFVRRNLPSVARISGFRRIEEPAIPSEALREVIVNAVVHRNYLDPTAEIHLQIEGMTVTITNPGGVLPPLTIGEILAGGFLPRSRNATITDALVRVGGFMDKRGSGIHRVEKAMAARGLPPPSLEENAGSFRIILTNNNLPKPQIAGRIINEADLKRLDLKDSHFEILKIIEKIGDARPGEIIRQLEKSRPYVNKKLKELLKKGVLVRSSSGAKTDPNTKYAMNPQFLNGKSKTKETKQQTLL